MKKQILSLIFVIITAIGFSQTMPTLTKTSNLTPITINYGDTLLVPIGDSVWINNIDAWNTANFGDAGNFYLYKIDIMTSAATCIDTVVIGNNDKYRFNITALTKYRYGIRRASQPSCDIFFYIKGTTGTTTGITNHESPKFNLMAYPNPAVDNLTISFDATSHNQTVSVFDIQGRSVIVNTDEREMGTNTVKLDVTALNTGIYFVRTGSDTFKIAKQ